LNAGKRVTIHYTGTLDDGTVFDSSIERHQPLEFVVGAHEVLAGLDKAVNEMGVGDKAVVHIPAAQAYGLYDEALVEAVPVGGFPNVGQLPVGDYIVLQTDGGALRVRVDRIEDGYVYLDQNHELAGKDLTFEVEVLHIHGEGGSNIEKEKHHHGCSCGCDVMKEQLA
jgi:FKBP-type peptidyl-prolyl cis-trans isomerase 2